MAVVPQKLLSLIRDMGDYGSEPIQSGTDRQRSGALLGIGACFADMVADRGGIRVIMQSGKGEGRVQAVRKEAFAGGGIIGLDRLAAEDGEAGMAPREQQIDDGLGDYPFGQQTAQQLVAEQAHHLLGVDPREGVEAAVTRGRAVGGEAVKMGVENNRIAAICLDGYDYPGQGVPILQCLLEKFLQGFVERPAEQAKELAVVLEVNAQRFGDGNDILTVRHMFEQFATDAFGEGHHPLLVA